MKTISEVVFGPRAQCNACGRNFRPNLKDDELDNGGLRRWFACPYCGTEYQVAIISKRGRVLTQQIQELVLASGSGQVEPRRARAIAKLREQLAREIRHEHG